MTLFKKSLALLLALTMIFSTMSVMGYAADDVTVKYYTHMNADGTIGTHNGNNGFEFVVKFYRWAVTDDKGTPETTDDVYDWIETDRAKPGEDVQARVFVGTEYPTYSNVTAATTFDIKYLTAKNSGTYDLIVNPSHSSGLSIGGVQGGSVFENPYTQSRLKLANKKSFFNKPGKVTDDSGKVISESYYLPQNYFGEDQDSIVKGLVVANAQLSGTKTGATALSVNDWVYAIDFTVNNDSYVKTPGNKGYAEVPLELVNQKQISSESNAICITDIPKFEEGSVDTQFGAVSLTEFDAYGETTPGYISVFSNITFDAVAEEGGYFESGESIETIPGVIGESVDSSSLSIANSSNKDFVGWSLTKGGEVIADDFELGYEDITLYAVWKDSDVKTYYTYEMYQMKEDGTYPDKPFSQQIYHAADESVSIKETDAPEGFYLDTKKDNVLSGVVSANNSTVLRAYFARKQYTVTYHYSDNNGPQKDILSAYHGQVLPEFEAVSGGKPVVPGKEFIGWSQSESENIAPPVVMPMENVDLYPIYEDIVYTYVYDANGGEFIDGETLKSFVYKYGDTPAEFKEIPVMTGHEFTCWDIEAPATVTEDLTFKAEYSVGKYTVKFVDSKGNTLYEDTFDYGEEITEEYIPDGYKSDAWTFEDGVKVKFPFTLEDDVVITASEDANVYKVTFLVDGKVYEEYEIASGNAVVVPEENPKDKIGYKFEMWDPAPEGQYVDEEDLVFDAIFVKGEYTLSFDTDGGTAVDSITALYEDPIADKLPGENATSKKGHTFIGWDTKLPETMPGEDTTIKAKWNPEMYTIIFDTDGGSKVDPMVVTYGQTVIAPEAPTKEGFEFIGWSPELPTKMDDIGDNGAIMTVTAIWSELDTRDDLVVDANGGTYADGTSIKNHKFNTGDLVDGAIEEPTREGYEFDGWDGLDAEGKMPAGDTTITAKWIAKVTIDPNGGKFADGTTAKIETTGTSIDLTGKLPVKKDKAEFKGWKDTLTDTIYDEIPATSDKPLNLVAQWDEEEQYTITYFVGNNVHKTDFYYEGDPIVLPEAPTVTGFDFGGWKLKDGTDVPATMEAANLEAIAVLNPHKHNVTFYLDDAKTIVYKEYNDVAFGSEIEVPADPTHPTNPELVFAGWNPTVESEMPDNDLEYVATWTEVGESFTAHFVADGKTHKLFVLKEGDEIPEVPDPKKFGFKFVGWEPEVPETMPGESIVFEAQWEIDKTFASIIIGGTVIGGGAIAGLIGTGAVIGGSIIGGILVIWGGVELAKNTFTVTYKVDGEVYKTYKVIAGTKIPVPADPTKDGKEFAGWNPEVPEKMPKENLVFEAEWKSASDVDIPSTGSVSGMAALAAISAAGAVAILATRKKKDEDEE